MTKTIDEIVKNNIKKLQEQNKSKDTFSVFYAGYKIKIEIEELGYIAILED